PGLANRRRVAANNFFLNSRSEQQSECFMNKLQPKILIGPLLCLLVSSTALQARAQNFGSSMTRKKITLQRKLPPTGHVDGTSINVVATAKGFQADIAPDL